MLLLVLCQLAGEVVKRLGMPPLAGMLATGFVLRNAGAVDGISSLVNSKVRPTCAEP